MPRRISNPPSATANAAEADRQPRFSASHSEGATVLLERQDTWLDWTFAVAPPGRNPFLIRGYRTICPVTSGLSTGVLAGSGPTFLA